jgi:AraC-like DNA-binding protein
MRLADADPIVAFAELYGPYDKASFYGLNKPEKNVYFVIRAFSPYLNLRYMPIYMDRHDVPESVSADVLAKLHQEDVKVQHQFCCKGITYWFDDDRKTAFCLIEAPNKEAIQEMHEYAHGAVPNQVIEVDPMIVQSFLGRIADPLKAQNTELNIIRDPAFRTIMVIRIKLLALTKADLGRYQSRVGWLAASAPRVLTDFEGSLVKRSKDDLLISFRSVSGAVHAAMALQKDFGDGGEGGTRERVLLKIGLSTGVPVTDKSLIFEDAIRLAERMTMAGKENIVVSAEVRELYDGENPVGLASRTGVSCLTPGDEQFINRLMDHADRCWTDVQLKVDDLNKEMGYSKPQLYRKLVSLTGKSPVSFIQEYRLKEALNLLNREAGNVSQIAYESGFSSPSYFAKCFQKRFGRSPSEYLAARAGA